MEKYTQSRRNFLSVAGTGVAAASVGLCGGCASGDSGAQSSGLQASSVSEGDATILGDNNSIVLMRDSGGLYAMSLICKHLGCNIGDTGTVSASELVCQCHGSTYDGVGGNTGGPAQEPLDHLQVTVDADGNVTVDAGTTVDSATRADAGTA